MDNGGGRENTMIVSRLAYYTKETPPLQDEVLYPELTVPMPSNADFWNLDSLSRKAGDILQIDSGGIAEYTGDSFNKIMQFDILCDIQNEWFGIQLRQSNSLRPPWEQQSAYVILVKNDGKVYLNKAQNGVFIENILVVDPGFDLITPSKRHTYRAGVIDADGKAIVVLQIDGHTIFEYTDNEPIIEAGTMSFMTMGPQATATVYLAEATEEPPEEDLPGTGGGHGYIHGDVPEEWINNRPDIFDDDYIYEEDGEDIDIPPMGAAANILVGISVIAGLVAFTVCLFIKKRRSSNEENS